MALRKDQAEPTTIAPTRLKNQHYVLGQTSWSKPTLSLALKQFQIKTVLDCRKAASSAFKIFTKKNIRKLCNLNQVQYQFCKQIAAANRLDEDFVSNCLASVPGPILILFVPDETSNSLNAREAVRILTKTSKVRALKCAGVTVSAEDYDDFVEEEAKAEVIPEIKIELEAPKRKSSPSKVQKVKVSGNSLVYSNEIVRSCGLVIFSTDLRSVLCISRTQAYELPKGRIEKGEDYRETALRELEEEAGVLNAKKVLNVRWHEAVRCAYSFKNQTKEVYFFCAKLKKNCSLEFGPREKRTRYVDFLRLAGLHADLFKNQETMETIFSFAKRPLGSQHVRCFQPFRLDIDDKRCKKHLDKYGFLVVRNVLSKKELEEGEDLFWEYLRSLGSGIKRDDPKTWCNENWPDRFGSGIMAFQGAGHSDFAWYCRTKPNVRKVFEKVFNRKDLVASFDAIGAFRPWHFEESWKTDGSWYHFDQNPIDEPKFECLQGFISFKPANELTGGFSCAPGSHKMFADLGQWMLQKRISSRAGFLRVDKIKAHPVANLPRYLIFAEPGDFIVWDSRTMHANTHALEKAPEGTPVDLIRMTAYNCMVPSRDEHTPEFFGKRMAGVETYVTTSHKAWLWIPTLERKATSEGRRKRNLKALKCTKRKRALPEGAEALILGQAPIWEDPSKEKTNTIHGKKASKTRSLSKSGGKKASKKNKDTKKAKHKGTKKETQL